MVAFALSDLRRYNFGRLFQLGGDKKIFESLVEIAGPSFAGSSNGRTSPSEGEYLGSNPSPAAHRWDLVECNIICFRKFLKVSFMLFAA